METRGRLEERADTQKHGRRSEPRRKLKKRRRRKMRVIENLDEGTAKKLGQANEA